MDGEHADQVIVSTGETRKVRVGHIVRAAVLSPFSFLPLALAILAASSGHWITAVCCLALPLFPAALLWWYSHVCSRAPPPRITIDKANRVILFENYPDPKSPGPGHTLPEQTVAFEDIRDVWWTGANTRSDPFLSIAAGTGGDRRLYGIGQEMSNFDAVKMALLQIAPRVRDRSARPWSDRVGPRVYRTIMSAMVLVTVLIVAVIAIIIWS